MAPPCKSDIPEISKYLLAAYFSMLSSQTNYLTCIPRDYNYNFAVITHNTAVSSPYHIEVQFRGGFKMIAYDLLLVLIFGWGHR